MDANRVEPSEKFKTAFREAMDAARLHGWADGLGDGYAKGRVEGEAHAVLTVLRARGIAVPPEVREAILAALDPAILGVYLRRAVRAETAAAVTEPVSARELAEDSGQS